MINTDRLSLSNGPRFTAVTTGVVILTLAATSCSSREEINSSEQWSRAEIPITAPTLAALECTDVGGGKCSTKLNTDTLFPTGESILTSSAITVVDRLAATVHSNGKYVQLVGHADGQGDSESNQALSQQRAEAIRQALVDRGISPEVISTCGVGDAGAEPDVDDPSFRRVDAVISEAPPSTCPAV